MIGGVGDVQVAAGSDAIPRVAAAAPKSRSASPFQSLPAAVSIE